MQDWTPADLQNHLDAGDGVFLKIWKKGCGPCKLSTPAVERLEAADSHSLKFGQILADDHPEIMSIADTDVLPAFFIFRDKQMKGKFIGFKGLAKLQEFYAQAMDGAS